MEEGASTGCNGEKGLSQRGSVAFMEEGGVQCEGAKARGHLLVKGGGECHMEEGGLLVEIEALM